MSHRMCIRIRVYTHVHAHTHTHTSGNNRSGMDRCKHIVAHSVAQKTRQHRLGRCPQVAFTRPHCEFNIPVCRCHIAKDPTDTGALVRAVCAQRSEQHTGHIVLTSVYMRIYVRVRAREFKSCLSLRLCERVCACARAITVQTLPAFEYYLLCFERLKRTNGASSSDESESSLPPRFVVS